MKCSVCGYQNVSDAKFCEKCGNKFEKPSKVKKSKTGKIGIVIGIMILVVFSINFGFVMKKRSIQKEYESCLAEGNKYMEVLEYEKAETFYLEAMSISPKEAEPYLRLADLYIVTGMNEKAADILEEVEKYVDDVEKDGLIMRQEKVEQRLHISQEYPWILEPTIEAKDINCVQEVSVDFEKYRNDCMRPYMSREMVVNISDRYGLITYDGISVIPAEYSTISRSGHVYFARMEGNSHSDMIDDNYQIFYAPFGWPTLKLLYYQNGILYQSSAEGITTNIETDLLCGVQDATHSAEIFSYNDSKYTGKFAVYKGKVQVTDFIYEKVISQGCGLIGVKKDGKWGYLNEKGETVIPAEFDDAWIHSMNVGNSDQEPFSSAYVPTENYIVLCKDGKYELRTIQNEVIIPSGFYEAIRPVYQGKAWVKENGKWGVIKIYDWEEPEIYTPVIESESINTEVPVQEYIQFSSYLLDIPRPDQPIYSEPNYNSTLVARVEKSGTYTIVEEKWDSSGNLWGKLKSGIGWVDLTQIKSGNQADYHSSIEATKVPYIIDIPRSDQPIYSEPNYNSTLVALIEKPGAYTIVEERWDSNGNLWGKLKSGIGWVDVIKIRSES